MRSAVMSPLAIAGDQIGTGPVIKAPTLPEGLEQFGIRVTRRRRPSECLRRAMCEMRFQVITIAKDARGIAGAPTGRKGNTSSARIVQRSLRPGSRLMNRAGSDDRRSIRR